MFFFIVYGIGAVASVTVVVTEYTLRLYFFLITSVVYEKYHYYAYRVLKERGFPAYLPHYRRKVNRLLFRLVNYFRPKSLIEVGIGNGASIGYMRAACHTMDSVTLKGRDWTKTSRQLEEKLSEVHTLDCLHIGHTPFYKEVLNWYFLMPDLVVVLLSEEFMNRGKNGNGGSKL